MGRAHAKSSAHGMDSLERSLLSAGCCILARRTHAECTVQRRMIALRWVARWCVRDGGTQILPPHATSAAHKRARRISHSTARTHSGESMAQRGRTRRATLSRPLFPAIVTVGTVTHAGRPSPLRSLTEGTPPNEHRNYKRKVKRERHTIAHPLRSSVYVAPPDTVALSAPSAQQQAVLFLAWIPTWPAAAPESSATP